MPDPFASLSVYRAAHQRIVLTTGAAEERQGAGGGLQAAFETVGRRPLLDVLHDPQVAEIELTDADLSVRVQRASTGARFQVQWSGQVTVDELVPLPHASVTGPGPWFRPEPDSEVHGDPLATPEAVYAVEEGDAVRWYTRGLHGPGLGQRRLRGSVPAVQPHDLGSAAFRSTHGVKWAYVAGAMAGGIASADLVIAMAKANLLGFFGAGGVPEPVVHEALERVSKEVADRPFGFNLLHNPNEPAVEEHTVDLYLQYGVRRVSASAYLGLTPAVVRYRLTGLTQRPDGTVHCPNHVFAKVSRPEVAEKFLRPAPDDMVQQLVQRGVLTPQQATWARQVPMAEDITAEADSGGHTDHRPLPVLLPSLMALRDRIAQQEGYAARGIAVRVGAAGGLGTPQALYGAFAMGADYVLTGSVNQSASEAGTSPMAKQMLGAASWWEVASGPAPDMFEMGAKVQVLSRGSMYAQRAQRLYDIYKAYPSIEAIPPNERARIEKQMFKRSLDEVWAGTREYWAGRDPKQVERADADPHHKMALTFRWYLGMTSRWARTGDQDRKRDFQMWCGPAMGAFNEWAADGALAAVEQRSVVGIAQALMTGAAGVARRHLARSLGMVVG